MDITPCRKVRVIFEDFHQTIPVETILPVIFLHQAVHHQFTHCHTVRDLWQVLTIMQWFHDLSTDFIKDHPVVCLLETNTTVFR